MLDITSAGLGQALLNMLKVAGYYIATGAVVGLTDYIGNVSILNKENVMVVAIFGVINIALAGLQKWLTTKK